MKRSAAAGFAALVLVAGCSLAPAGGSPATAGASGQAPSPSTAESPGRASSPTASARIPAEPGIRGRLANPGFENERIATSLFFAGQARDGTAPYGCNPAPNLGLYTLHPSEARDLTWSTGTASRDFVVDQMVGAGLNAVSMSSWGQDSLPCSTGWVPVAPMQTAPGAQDELYAAAMGRHLVIVPFIESRADWAMRDEFPTASDGRVAPGTVGQVVNLIDRYLRNPAHPEWAQEWAQVYDRSLRPRYAVALIHASSNRLGPRDDQAFADGFDAVADAVLAQTGVEVGFFIDPLPPNSNAPGTFRPGPESTGPALARTESILGIQSFIPEIWVSGSPTEAQLIDWKRDYSRRWSATGIPFLMDVSPGYDAHVVFPGSRLYGFSPTWQDALTSMVADFGRDGLVFNSWNGYTEGMVAVPTIEHGDQYLRWLEVLTKA